MANRLYNAQMEVPLHHEQPQTNPHYLRTTVPVRPDPGGASAEPIAEAHSLAENNAPFPRQGSPMVTVSRPFAQIQVLSTRLSESVPPHPDARPRGEGGRAWQQPGGLRPVLAVDVAVGVTLRHSASAWRRVAAAPLLLPPTVTLAPAPHCDLGSCPPL